MAGFPAVVRLQVLGGAMVPLGTCGEAGDLPELLRYVADYYDDNPDECEKLFGPQTRGAFGGSYGQVEFKSPES